MNPIQACNEILVSWDKPKIIIDLIKIAHVVMDSKMEIPSKKYLGKDGLFIFLVQSMVLCHQCQAKVVVIVQLIQQVQMLDKLKVYLGVF